MYICITNSARVLIRADDLFSLTNETTKNLNYITINTVNKDIKSK